MKIFNKQRDTVAIVIVLIILIKLINPSIIKKISNINYDSYQAFFEKEFDQKDIRIIDIDDRSLDEVGQFPWRRDKVAKIVDNLTSANPKVIAFDIFFSEPDRENPTKILKELSISTESVIDSDLEFTKSIKNSKIVLPIVGLTKKNNQNYKKQAKARFIIKGQSAKNFLYSFSAGLASLKEFNNEAKGIGSISILDSEDGTLRYIPLLVNIDDQVWPSLSLEIIRVANNQKNYLIKSNEMGIQTIKTRTAQFFTDENALIHLKYKKFNPDYYIPAVEVLNGEFDPSEIKDKIIIVGSSAAGLYDLVKTSSGRTIPGVQVHANIIDNILNNDTIIINNLTTTIENIILLIALISLSIVPKVLKPKYSIIYFSAFLTIIFFTSVIFYQFNYFINVFFSIIASTILFTITIYFRFVDENTLAIENEKKQLVLKQEREIAGEVQKKLFPPAKEKNDYIFAKNVPARDVSGDYFDYLRINDNEIYFTLADVSGKGIKAGMLMANASAVFRSMARLEKPVPTIARFVNNQVNESSYKGMFITAVIGKLDITKKEIEYINHGHEPVMIMDKEFKFEYRGAALPPLGLMKMKDDTAFKTTTENIADKVVLIYTDGVTEGYLKDGSELRVDGLEREIIKTNSLEPVKIIERVCEILTESNEKLRDDVTCLGISV
tara:strand:- start:920 stop:2917 length:1998 start_codon:yes stop_codon:yes gene_type:complete